MSHKNVFKSMELDKSTCGVSVHGLRAKPLSVPTLKGKKGKESPEKEMEK